MQVLYSVLLKGENGQKHIQNGEVEIDSELGFFGDKDYNRKSAEAIFKKHPGCEILEFGPEYKMQNSMNLEQSEGNV